MANQLKEHIRGIDIPARYGGEEFAVIFGNTQMRAAYELAEKIRMTIHAQNIPRRYATQAECLTISAGVATLYPAAETETSPSVLIEAADRCLYQAKQSGRNRVCAEGKPINVHRV